MTPVVHEVVSVRELRRVGVSADASQPTISVEPSSHGASVVLLECTASAVGWTLASVVDVARVMAPEIEHFGARRARME